MVVAILGEVCNEWWLLDIYKGNVTEMKFNYCSRGLHHSTDGREH